MRIPPSLALALLLLAPVALAQTEPDPPPAQPTPAEDVAEGQRLLARRRAADLLAARRRFERAIAADAKLAPAFAGLAETRALLFDYPGAREAAEQALALDDGLAAAHAVLGFVRMHKDWDWAGAEARRAVELAPDQVHVRAGLGFEELLQKGLYLSRDWSIRLSPRSESNLPTRVVPA